MSKLTRFGNLHLRDNWEWIRGATR